MTPFPEIRHRCLLVTLFAFLLLEPVLSGSKRLSHLTISVLISVVFVAAVFAVAPSRRYRFSTMAVGLVGIVLRWLSNVWLKDPAVVALADVLVAMFFGLCVFILMAHIFRSDRIGSETIAAAVSAYLLLGLSWARVYHGFSQLHPEVGFLVRGEFSPLTDLNCTYFSFITLTTVGYGDIVPVAPFVRRLALIEGLTGVFFLAVIISWIISQLRNKIRDV